MLSTFLATVKNSRGYFRHFARSNCILFSIKISRKIPQNTIPLRRTSLLVLNGSYQFCLRPDLSSFSSFFPCFFDPLRSDLFVFLPPYFFFPVPTESSRRIANWKGLGRSEFIIIVPLTMLVTTLPAAPKDIIIACINKGFIPPLTYLQRITCFV